MSHCATPPEGEVTQTDPASGDRHDVAHYGTRPPGGAGLGG